MARLQTPQAVLCSVCVLAAAAFVGAESPSPRPPQVPPNLQWVHRLEVEGAAERDNRGDWVGHSQIRLRYLDPEERAFVGMQWLTDWFPERVTITDPKNDLSGHLYTSIGAHIGRLRSGHALALDLMGATIAGKLGPAVAIAGEHPLGDRLALWHRTQISVFRGDGIWDADQGFYIRIAKGTELRVGYRWWESRYANRSGPHAGLRFYFESLKIPFIFPSVG